MYEKEIEYINSSIEKKNYAILGDNIAIGKIMKFTLCGNLDFDGYEFGYLALSSGSSIKQHIHINDVERYKLLSGKLSVDGNDCLENICLLNNYHNIDSSKNETIIQTCKINRLYFPNLEYIPISEFDKIEHIALNYLNEKLGFQKTIK